MKKLMIIAEAPLTENQARNILEHGKLVWDKHTPIAKLNFRGVGSYIELKFKSASIVDVVEI